MYPAFSSENTLRLHSEYSFPLNLPSSMLKHIIRANVWSSLLTMAGRSLSGWRGNAIAHGSDRETPGSRIQPSAMFEFSALSSRPGPPTAKHRALSDPCFQKIPLSRLQQKHLLLCKSLDHVSKSPRQTCLCLQQWK